MEDMKKYFYLVLMMVFALPTSVLAGYGDPSEIELYPYNNALRQVLLCGYTYTSAEISDIRSGSISVSEDGQTLTLNNLDMECDETGSDGELVWINTHNQKTFSIVLEGRNLLKTKGYEALSLNSHYYNDSPWQATMSGSGSLSLYSDYIDMYLTDGQLTIDHTVLECSNGSCSVSGNNYQIIAKSARFQGKNINNCSQLTLEDCYFKLPYKGWFDPKSEDYQIKDVLGNAVGNFLITTLGKDEDETGFVVKGNFEETDFSSFLYRYSGTIHEVTLNDITDENGNHCLKIASQASAENTWDSQLLIKIPELWSLSYGAFIRFSMRVKASRPAKIPASLYEPTGVYFENMFGIIDVTTEWQTVSGYYAVSRWCSSQDFGDVKSILLDLNSDKEQSVDFYFDDIRVTLVDAKECDLSQITFSKQTLQKNHTYMHENFPSIKSGCFSVSEDGNVLTFDNLIIESDNFAFTSDIPLKLVLKGESSVSTSKYAVMDVTYCRNLTITGDGSLTTCGGIYDYFILGCNVLIDHTTLICNGWHAFGNNMWATDKVTVNHSTLKANTFFRIASLTLINSAFVSPENVVFDPKDDNGSQLYTPDGQQIWGVEIQPAEGNFSHRVSPWKFDDIIMTKGETKDVVFSMKNDGIEDVREIAYVLSYGGVETQEKTISLQEPYTKTGDDFSVTIPVDAGNQVGKTDLIVTVTKVNGQENASDKKTVKGILHTTSKLADRRVVVEEFTGTWCGWCTRGMVALDMLNQEYNDKVITIAVHVNDPMSTESYTLGSSSLPTAMVNRSGGLFSYIDPYSGSSGNPYGIKEDVDRELNIAAPADISVSANWADKDHTVIDVDTETSFVINTDATQYGIGYVLLEDGMKGTGRDWAQNNFYSGSYSDDPNLQSITDLPSLLTDMEYDHVAVAAWAVNNGVDNCFNDVQVDVPQKNTYRCDISGNRLIQDKTKLSVVVLLIDRRTGQIVNAAKTIICNLLPGDVNGDGNVNAEDISEVSNHILGIPSKKFNKMNADANGDGVINAADIVAIVNLIK